MFNPYNEKQFEPKKFVRILWSKKKNALWTKNHYFLKLPQNSIVTLTYIGLLKKKQKCEKLILLTKVKIGMHILVRSAHVFTMANFTGTHTPMHVLKKWRKER